ncbi:hypothetical protein [Alkalihalobacterium alkalinitrilicum]|uniref:hypothetical protein n=1 Tax=Alkalihalobacterium alkalinitrilicum TaxID=427920 RepID=UPI0013038997|nr:hypothetical protein [Alkalihalobacterium alkalinitrilicum]
MNDKFNERHYEETSILSRAKKELKEKFVTIQLTEDMLGWVVNKKKIKGITSIAVRLIEDKIVISGAMKKLRLTIPFRIDLKPLVARDRELSFKVVSLKPLNHHWITTKLLNKSPFLHYHKGIIHIDLNQIEKAKAIRVGNVKRFEVKDERLWIGIGL